MRPTASAAAALGLLVGLTVSHWLLAHPRAGEQAAEPVATGEDLRLPPWSEGVPPWARSVRIPKGDQPLRHAPDGQAERRGSAAREARLPLFGARKGPGCGGPWLQVGAAAWVCSDATTYSGAAPILPSAKLITAAPDGLPFRYYFAGRDGSLAYHRIEEVDVGEPAMTLEPGFAVAVVEERNLGRERYGRTNRGLWVPMRDLGPARSFHFEGSEVTDTPNGVVPFAWVVEDDALLYERRGQLFAPTASRASRFDRVGFLEEANVFGARYVRIDDRHWIRHKQLAHPTLLPPPEESEIAHGARWIDIELESQTLVAYEGERPVFATIVSTGKGKTKGHPFETPKGVHRIWVKLLATTMDNLENENANRYWRIEDVPYVQFFHKGVGLHAAFWHRSFGHVRSHGCVNLAPRDAARLFAWTGPEIPAGWTAALPTAYDRGTIVRVR